MGMVTDLDVRLDAFVRDGYVVFPGQLHARCIAELHVLRARLAMQERFLSGSDDVPDFVGHLVEQSPRLVLPLVADSVMLEFAELAMGPFVQLDGCVLAGFPPQPHSRAGEVVEWHRDRHGSFPSGAYAPPLAILVLCYLQDMTPETGPLRVIPGSHVYPVAIPETRLADPHPDEQLLEVRAGDAVVIHHNLIHSGTHNVTSGERRFFSFTYSHSALHQDEEFKGPNCQRLRERARRQADRRLLRLLGEDETLQARVNTGFTWPTRQDWRRWSREDDEVCRSPVIASVHTDRWYRDD